MSRRRKLVPNDFTITLSQHDYDRLTPYGKTLNAEIIPELKEHAKERGYLFNGPIRINLEVDPKLPTGRFTVDSSAVAAVDTDDPANTQMILAARLVLEVNGMRHPLQPPGFTIGRGSDADLRVNDPGISRRHAEIQVHAGGRIRIVDLGSTNGIVVNGNRVREADIGDGSRIEIGSTRMLVHAPQDV